MFIKEIKKQNKGYDKVFTYCRLMEAYRSDKGPRQRLVLNLGPIELPRDKWKSLADRIEQLVEGQKVLYPVGEEIEQLAQHYAQIIIRENLYYLKPEAEPEENEQAPQYESVDLGSLESSECRQLGAEYVGLAMLRELGLDKLFERLGFSREQCELACLAIVGKLVHPGSEQETRRWASRISALDELLGADFRHISNNALYRISDLLLENKEAIERHLRQTERDIFSLSEKIILYDLTNTYFEGDAEGNPDAARGRSKDKQSGRPLVTLGLVLDERGFSKASQILKGNISEPKTLLEMVEALRGTAGSAGESGESGEGATVLLDAGIATEENLALLKSRGYHYVCVSRSRPAVEEPSPDSFVVVKQDVNNQVEARLLEAGEERLLYCKSLAKGKKEEAMKTLFQERFEEGLKLLSAALSKKGGTKKYDKVMIRLGRLQEKYAGIAHYYRIEVAQQEGIATSVNWRFVKEEQAIQRYSGRYFLRTSRADLDEKELWSLYTMLTTVEDAFRCLKSELELRPVFHQSKKRCDGHLFITVLAYHLLNCIRERLRASGINMRWERIRQELGTHVRITSSIKTEKGERLHIRNTTIAEPFHRAVYHAMGLASKPLANKRIKICSAHTTPSDQANDLS